eukprot:TRINITY_DN67764_c3_g2_i1.p1 TRINITY_DN67764_c3_g2~~TRINITY_DN67764_c3_g2_i1.p1  ORF type:complete len:282 (-),score=2.97 TRINITY_DN67764_c3_g2_i1:141-986(-)
MVTQTAGSCGTSTFGCDLWSVGCDIDNAVDAEKCTCLTDFYACLSDNSCYTSADQMVCQQLSKAANCSNIDDACPAPSIVCRRPKTYCPQNDLCQTSCLTCPGYTDTDVLRGKCLPTGSSKGSLPEHTENETSESGHGAHKPDEEEEEGPEALILIIVVNAVIPLLFLIVIIWIIIKRKRKKLTALPPLSLGPDVATRRRHLPHRPHILHRHRSHSQLSQVSDDLSDATTDPWSQSYAYDYDYEYYDSQPPVSGIQDDYSFASYDNSVYGGYMYGENPYYF